MRRSLGLVAVLGLAAACSHDGRVLVVVDTDLPVPGAIGTVRAIVRSAAGEQVRDFTVVGREGEPGDRAELVPLSFLVVPRDSGGERDFEVVVEGHRGTSPSGTSLVVSRRAITGFIAGRTLVLPLPLLSSCTSVVCPAEQTCTENGCEDATVDPATLREATSPGEETERPDASVDAGPMPSFGCARWSPFGPTVGVPELNNADRDCCASITEDELTIVFYSDREGGRVWEASRATPSDPFGVPFALDTQIGANAEEPAISEDGLTLYYQLSAGPIDHATRAGRTDRWVAMGPVPGTVVDFIAPALTGDELTMLLSTPGDVRDLYTTTRATRAMPFSAPMRLDEISTDMAEGYPSISPDGLVVFFHRQIGSDSEILTASRAARTDQFGAAVALPELGESGDPEITADGDTIWFNGFFAGADLYYATRECLEPLP